MIARRYVFDEQHGAVVELGKVRVTVGAAAAYADVEGQYRQCPDEGTGLALRNAALERADRRVHAHRRTGDERRWTE